MYIKFHDNINHIFQNTIYKFQNTLQVQKHVFRIASSKKQIASSIFIKISSNFKDHTANDVWDFAQKTYIVTHNSSRLFQLQRQSVTTCQNGEPMNVSHEKLHVMWQQIDYILPSELTNPSDAARRQKEIEVNLVLVFFTKSITCLCLP